MQATARDPFSLNPEATTHIVDSVQHDAPVPHAASPAQLGFLSTLVEERDYEGLNGNLYERAFDVATGSGKFISKAEATQLITALKGCPKLQGPTAPTQAPEGMHLLRGEVFKVQIAVHGSGRPYAKRLEKGSGEFVYDKGAIRNLSEDTLMTLEQAKEFGHLYGRCCRCGRTLTDEGSIAAGIGPVCATKF